MPLAFYWVPARNGQSAQDALNAGLQSLRVIGVEKHFSSNTADPGWAVCVEYLDAEVGAGEKKAGGARRVDYREILDPATFTIFPTLRKLRKEIAEKEGVPIYAVMSNEQLAEIARRRCGMAKYARTLPADSFFALNVKRNSA